MRSEWPKFDRSVPPEFLELFRPGSGFANLVDFSKSRDPLHESLDLHFRASNDGKSGIRATLYLGTSKAVDIEFNQKTALITIKPQKGARFEDGIHAFEGDFGELDKLWGDPTSISEAQASWQAAGAGHSFVQSLVEKSFNKKSPAWRYLRPGGEGCLQANLTRFTDDFTVIDRESVPEYEIGNVDKLDALEVGRAPIREALKRLQEKPGEAWTRTKEVPEDVRPPNKKDEKAKKNFGDELDALAIDDQGRVLVIEVKGGKDTGGTAWTPAQVLVYLELFRGWVASKGAERSRKVLTKMLEQRRQLGLTGKHNISLSASGELELVPVIVVGRIKKKRSAETANQRMVSVIEALSRETAALSSIEIWQETKCRGNFEKIEIGHLKSLET